MRILVIVLIFFLSMPSVSLAQEKTYQTNFQTFELKKDQLLPFVEKLITAGKLAEAREILGKVKGQTTDPLQEDFLLAQIAVAEKRYQDAVNIYRSMLVQRPELTRVRLELARTFFLMKDDANARFHFELVLAEDLPEAVIKNIQNFLFAIRKRKQWQINSYIALAPDTNISAAPDTDTIDLFGLPFQLSEDAQETSGVGVIGSLGFDYFWRLGERTSLKTGANVYHTQYGNSQFNDTFLSGNIGPRFVFDKTAVTVQATGYRRWFGGDALNYAAGGQVLVDHVLSRRWRVDANLGWQELRYDRSELQNGRLWTGLLRFGYSLTSSSLVHLISGVTREQTQDVSFSNTSWRLGVGYYKDFGEGFTLYIKPEILLRDYDGVSIANAGETNGGDRQDTRYSIETNITKRDWSIWNFALVLSYTFTRNDSNIEFFKYNRHRVQIGFTRTF